MRRLFNKRTQTNYGSTAQSNNLEQAMINMEKIHQKHIIQLFRFCFGKLRSITEDIIFDEAKARNLIDELELTNLSTIFYEEGRAFPLLNDIEKSLTEQLNRTLEKENLPVNQSLDRIQFRMHHKKIYHAIAIAITNVLSEKMAELSREEPIISMIQSI